MWTKKFWVDAAERSIKTVAQAAVAVLGSGVIGAVDVDWANLLRVSVVAGVASVATSIASSGLGRRDSASLVE